MAEHDEHESRPEGAAGPDRTDAEPPGDQEGDGRRGAATSPGVGGAPTEHVAAGGDPRGPARWRRWSTSGPVRMGAVALAAGLIGGLVGGGIVAAFSGDDHDGHMMRVERAVPFGGGPGFRRYWGPPPGWYRPGPPAVPTPQGPPPSPKATG